MAEVKVPASFFRSELRVYSNWREAFARELLQNALDATPGRIEIEIDDSGDGVSVRFRDYGTGMSRRVLEEVFFALGETTKNGTDSIGGFGRARIITCFAQRAYRIRTRNLLVHGNAGEYRVEEVTDPVEGTEFVIDTIDDDPSELRSAFAAVLRRSSLPVPVVFDGELIRPRPYGRAARVLRDSDGRPWARVYLSDSGVGQLLVRSAGLMMFSRWVWGLDRDVVLELHRSSSRAALSASRDNLNQEYNDIFDQFVGSLSKNRRQALREPAAPLDMHVRAGGWTQTVPVSAMATDPAPGLAAAAAESVSSPLTTGAMVSPPRPAVEARPVGERDRLDLAPHTVPLGFDVYLYAQEGTRVAHRLAREWNPANWDGSEGRRRALLHAWRAACRTGVEVLSELSGSAISWTVGWTFDDDVRATHRSVDGGHVLALNPLTSRGTRRWKLSCRESRRQLLATALHEVAHIAAGDHDETFASTLTRLYGHVDPAAADNAIRAAARG